MAESVCKNLQVTKQCVPARSESRERDAMHTVEEDEESEVDDFEALDKVGDKVTVTVGRTVVL
jgi:hypothetical protein